MITSINSVSFIGAGNVATHMARRLHASGIEIKEIWSRHLKNAEVLARSVNAEVCNSVSQLAPVDLVIISVKDDAVAEVISRLPENVTAVVHTSGGLELDMFGDHIYNTGVLYALQTFNKNETINWNEIPVCTEASNPDFLELLNNLGLKLSDKVTHLNSADRNRLHVAAVIVNNFTNYLYSASYEYLLKYNIRFELLLPLIQQTAKRLSTDDPFLLQTGPAIRNDVHLMDKHVNVLNEDEKLQELYRYMSDLIIKKTGK